jgi:hypothetical protein
MAQGRIFLAAFAVWLKVLMKNFSVVMMLTDGLNQ